MKKIYLIAVVIALAAGFATYFFANELKTSKIVTGVDEATVLVAVEDIDKNTVLTKEMFQEVKLPMTAVSYGTVCKANDIVGYVTTEKIYAGEQLMARKIALMGSVESDGRLSYQLENGMYAYTISVNVENGVGYFIKENDRINIYRDVKTGPAPSKEPLLQNVPVIKIGDYPANIQQDAGSEITTYMVITLALTKDQIPLMLEVENADGEIDTEYRIVLVSHAEGHGIADDIANVSIPEEKNKVPQTNYGMGEITTAPPDAEE